MAALLGVVLAAGMRPAQAITLNLTYDQIIPFSTAEQGVIDHAASLWEGRIVSSNTVSVTVRKSTSLGTLLGRASNYSMDTNGLPTGGTIEFNANTNFFVDPDPQLNQEFTNVTATFLTASGGGPAVGQFDLLSTALHEFCHVLGFACSFPRFGGLIMPATTIPAPDWHYNFLHHPPALGDPTNDYSAGVLYPNGAVDMADHSPVWDGGEETAGEAGMGCLSGLPPYYLPSHIDYLTPGPYGGFFPDDLMNPVAFTGERRLISYADLDILAHSFDYPVTAAPLAVAFTSTNTVVVWWPSPSTGFALQQKDDLNAPLWGTPSETVQDNGIFKFIVVNPPSHDRFYRLFKP